MEIKRKPYSAEKTTNFVSEWLEFDDFCDLFFLKISEYLLRKSDDKIPLQGRATLDEPLLEEVREWHRRRSLLRELLYLVDEQNLIVQDIPGWRRLKLEDN